MRSEGKMETTSQIFFCSRFIILISFRPSESCMSQALHIMSEYWIINIFETCLLIALFIPK